MDKAAKGHTNTANGYGSACEQYYTNTRQEADRPEKCYTNTDRSLNSKSNHIDKPMTNSNKINYFLPGPKQENDKRVSSEITQQIQRYFKVVFNGIGCFDGAFSLQVKLESESTTNMQAGKP